MRVVATALGRTIVTACEDNFLAAAEFFPHSLVASAP